MTTTASINSAMLFLFTITNVEVTTPRLIDTVGELSTTFNFDGHELYRSCGVTFRNKGFIFGGEVNKRQILQLDDCGLVNIGSTPFDYDFGACCSTDEVILLCFDVNYLKRCLQASVQTGPWIELAKSSYEHKQVSIATSLG